MSDPIQIWCDGSYRQEHGNIGIGWVRAVAGGDPVEHSSPLPKLKPQTKHGSDIAEYTAFASALSGLPDGAKVHVHMDCQNVIETLNKEALAPKHRGEADLVTAFTGAVSAKKRMGAVQISLTSDKNSPNMKLAHTLSRAASTPGKKTLKA